MSFEWAQKWADEQITLKQFQNARVALTRRAWDPKRQ